LRNTAAGRGAQHNGLQSRTPSAKSCHVKRRHFEARNISSTTAIAVMLDRMAEIGPENGP
jgi:hypothetical protein